MTDDNTNALNGNRGWMFSNDEIDTVMERAVVDITPEATSSEASGTTNRLGHNESGREVGH